MTLTICLEPGCTQPRYKRYGRCELHQKAVWARDWIRRNQTPAERDQARRCLPLPQPIIVPKLPPVPQPVQVPRLPKINVARARALQPLLDIARRRHVTKGIHVTRSTVYGT